MANSLTPSLQALKFLRHVTRPATTRLSHPFHRPYKHFHSSSTWLAIRTHKLSDVGEGTKEVQIIQWFVEEGARVEEWAKLCEVQSDKAAVDITSRYSGVIKKLHFKKDDIVQVGDVMVEFEVDGVEEEEEGGVEAGSEEMAADSTLPEQAAEQSAEENVEDFKSAQPEKVEQPPLERKEPGKYDSLATPAVRGLLKEYKMAIEDVQGSGKDGRVMKEDVHKYIAQRDSQPLQQTTAATMPHIDLKQVETLQKLTPIQTAMFKAMTVSLSIPHFLYSDSVNITQLCTMRTRINAARKPETTPKLSYLPFAIKAVSLALNQYPLLNARLDVSSDPKRPQ